MVLVELPAISAELYSKLICMLIEAGFGLAAGAGAGAVDIDAAPGRSARVWPGPSVAGSALRLLMIESTEGGSCAGCASCAQAIPLPASIAMASNGRSILVVFMGVLVVEGNRGAIARPGVAITHGRTQSILALRVCAASGANSIRRSA